MWKRALSSWTDPLVLDAGWLSGLTDLNTEREYVRERIADYFTDLLGVGFSGFRLDVKHFQSSLTVVRHLSISNQMIGLRF